MVLVVVVAVPCGWLKWKLDRKQRERQALAEVNRVGGNFNYDWQYAGQEGPPGPAWLRRLLGDDFFSRVVLLQLGGHHITDDWLIQMKPLSGVKHVYLKGNRISDVGLGHLRGLKLKELSILDSKISDAGLLHLQGQTDLTYLNLGKTGVTDAGLVHLKDLKQLGYLNLGETGVTATGVAELQKALPNCRIDW